jgi:hypothetical protein
MDLKDATLMVLAEAGGHPALAAVAQSVYDQLARGEQVGWQQLDQLTGEMSGTGVLRTLHARYSPVAYDAIMGPILAELGQRKPVPPRERPAGSTDPASDPLLASSWPSR